MGETLTDIVLRVEGWVNAEKMNGLADDWNDSQTDGLDACMGAWLVVRWMDE